MKQVKFFFQIHVTLQSTINKWTYSSLQPFSYMKQNLMPRDTLIVTPRKRFM